MAVHQLAPSEYESASGIDPRSRAASAPLIVFAGGGSGGHLYPPLAIATELRRIAPDARYLFFGTQRRIDRDVLSAAGEALITQDVRPFSTRPWHWPGFLRAWRASRKACAEYFNVHRPAVVLGTGGYASGPAVCQAAAMGIPTALLNPDTAPGRANRFLGRRVGVVLAQWEESRRYFDAQTDVRVVGCPIRRTIREADREVGLGRFGLSPERKTLLVTGASQGARSINLAVIGLVDDLARSQGWQVLHLTGEADLSMVEESYRRAGVKAVCLAYTEQMGDALAAADLVVSRAGASTLAEITALGKPSILVPYPHHRDGHQLSNARVLASRGAARISYDASDPRRSVRNLKVVLIGLMNDADELRRLAAGAARIGVKDAAERVADVLLELAAAGD